MIAEVAAAHGGAEADLDLVDGHVVSTAGPITVRLALAELIATRTIADSARFQHWPTYPLNADGQGDAHVSMACAAHRHDPEPDCRRSARSRAASPRASAWR